MKQSVVIIGHGYTSRLGIIRSLAKLNCDITVIVITFHNWLGRYLHFEGGKPVDCCSKYVRKVLYCRSKDEEGLLNLLVDKCAIRDQKTIIIPDSDYSAAFIDRYQDLLKNWFLFPHICHSGHGNLTYWMNKTVQKELASVIGLNVPHGCTVSIKQGVYKVPNQVSYPCFIKPQASIKGGKSFFKRCNNEDELQIELKSIARRFDTEVLIEDFMSIDKEYAVVGFSNGEEVIIPGVIEMLVNSQSHFGITRQGRITPNSGFDGVIEFFKGLVRRIGFYGLFDIDFYESDGELFFDEINLRFGGSGYAYSAMGVNLPVMLVRSLLGESIVDMQKDVLNKSTFVNERACIDDWVAGALSKREMFSVISNSDITFVYDTLDLGPQKKMEVLIKFQGFKRLIKRWMGKTIKSFLI